MSGIRSNGTSRRWSTRARTPPDEGCTRQRKLAAWCETARRTTPPGLAISTHCECSEEIGKRSAREELPDVLRLAVPAVRVHGERFGATGLGDRVKARLDDGESRAGARIFESEGHQRRRLGRIVDPGLNGIRMPAEGEKPLR